MLSKHLQRIYKQREEAQKKARKKYYQEHKEEKKEAQKKYRLSHMEERKLYQRNYIRKKREQNSLINIIRGQILGRDIEEYYCFNKADYKYINCIKINYEN